MPEALRCPYFAAARHPSACHNPQRNRPFRTVRLPLVIARATAELLARREKRLWVVATYWPPPSPDSYKAGALAQTHGIHFEREQAELTEETDSSLLIGNCDLVGSVSFAFSCAFVRLACNC